MAALTADANESLVTGVSGLIVTGLDNGDGLDGRLAASGVDDTRVGISTIRD